MCGRPATIVPEQDGPRRATMVSPGELAMLVIIWRFRPAAGREADFRRAYGPDGAWAQLFAKASGYLGTELLRDRGAGGDWITIDRWRTALEREAFTHRHAEAYAALDRECEALTAQEAKIGEFEDEGPVQTGS